MGVMLTWAHFDSAEVRLRIARDVVARCAARLAALELLTYQDWAEADELRRLLSEAVDLVVELDPVPLGARVCRGGP
jgi:hypothetical protein